MRIAILVCVCALAVASDAILVRDASAQIVPIGMGGGGPSGGASVGGTTGSDPLAAPQRDPAEQSAKSIECAQKADAQGLQGKNRKRFLHKCRSGA
jgi:hypothetical protein